MLCYVWKNKQTKTVDNKKKEWSKVREYLIIQTSQIYLFD